MDSMSWEWFPQLSRERGDFNQILWMTPLANSSQGQVFPPLEAPTFLTNNSVILEKEAVPHLWKGSEENAKYKSKAYLEEEAMKSTAVKSGTWRSRRKEQIEVHGSDPESAGKLVLWAASPHWVPENSVSWLGEPHQSGHRALTRKVVYPQAGLSTPSHCCWTACPRQSVFPLEVESASEDELGRENRWWMTVHRLM